jgi:DNA-directed RNA polymerase specialized sigma24 family protein
MQAWSALQGQLDGMIVRIARHHRDLRRKGLADCEDDLAEVRTSALERLATNDFHNLRTFIERSADATRASSFESWVYGVVDFAIRDHLRKRFGRAPGATAKQAGRILPSKRDLQSQAGRLDDEPERNLLSAAGVTTLLTVSEILAFIASVFTPEEVRAVQLYYIEGRDHEEIASELSLRDSGQAEQLIRRLNARLRYRFAPRDS